MDLDTFRAIQVLALDSIENLTWDSFYRKVCRWYSKTFSTPLKEVEALPETYVLQHYYENMIETVKDSPEEKADEQYATLRSSILHDGSTTDEEAEDDDKWAAALNEEIARAHGVAADAVEKAGKEIQDLIYNKEQLEEAFEHTVTIDDEVPDFDEDE